MSNVMSNVKIVNSVVRTGLMMVVAGGVGYGGWFGYTNYVKPSRDAKQALADLAELKADFEVQGQQLVAANLAKQKLETALKLIKVDRRMANVEVMEKGVDEQGNPYLEVRFTEIDAQGNPVGISRDFTLSGEKLYINCWIVSFEDKYVEEADPLRAASLCVFKGIYGEIDGPVGAKSLDQDSVQHGMPPGIYNDDRKNEFEAGIWGDFWRVCNDCRNAERTWHPRKLWASQLRPGRSRPHLSGPASSKRGRQSETD